MTPEELFWATTNGAHSVSVHRPWVELCRTSRSAGLLEAVVLGKLVRQQWWADNHEGGVVDDDGTRWTYITEKDWDRECFLSPSQAYRAVAKLETAGFISQRRAQREVRGATTGHPVRHVTVRAEVIGEALMALRSGSWDPERAFGTWSRDRDEVSGPGQRTWSRDRDEVGELGRGIATNLVAGSRRSSAHIRNELPTVELPTERSTTYGEFDPELADSEPPTTEQADVSAAIRADWRPAGADAPVALDLGDHRDRAAAIFRCWVLVHEKRGNVRLNDKRRKLINRAIKEYGDGNLNDGVATCLDAIRGSLADPYYRETGSAFADPEHILRIGGKADTRNNVEYFAGLWAEHGARYLETGRWPTVATARAIAGRGPVPLAEPPDFGEMFDYQVWEVLERAIDARQPERGVFLAAWAELRERLESADSDRLTALRKIVEGRKWSQGSLGLDASNDLAARCTVRLGSGGRAERRFGGGFGCAAEVPPEIDRQGRFELLAGGVGA